MSLFSLRGAAFLAALALAAPLRAQVPDTSVPDLAVADVGAPDTATLRLSDLIGQAASANPALAARLAGADALATRAAQDGALPDPTVALTGFPLPILTARGAQVAQLRAEQMMPWPGTLGLRARRADLASQAAYLDAEAFRLDLALAVRLAYHRLYEVDRTRDLVESFAQRLDAFTDAAAARYEVGRGPQGAILQLDLQRERLRARLLMLDAERQSALQSLARLTDRPNLVLLSAVDVAPPAPLADSLAAAALADRAEVQAARLAEARAAAGAELARKAFYPDLGFGLMYSLVTERDMPPTADGRDALGLTVMARVPLQRERLRAAAQEAQARRREAAARRDALETEIATQIAELAYVAERRAETVALYRERLIPQADLTVESLLAAYTTGQVDYLAFLDAERTRFDLLVAAEEAAARLLDARARLDRALGTPLPTLISNLR
jgi:outer membrane protein TolC